MKERKQVIADISGCRIRTAVPADESRIRELFIEMLMTIRQSDSEEGYPKDALDRFWSDGEDIIYVAEDRDVIAFLSVEVHRESPDYIYLDDFSVTGEYRSRGIGSALLRRAESYAGGLGIPRAALHVDKRNEAAMRFYRRAGYSVFRDDGDRYLMTKDLP